MVNIAYYSTCFKTNSGIITGLLTGLTKEEYTWKPGPGKWSLVEIICHLRDEEHEDFKPRLKSLLEDPQKNWTSIDPPAWVDERKYIEQELVSVLNDFLEERKKSMEWLETQHHAKWGNVYQHPQLGAMSAGFILANWLSHDYLHIRQIIKVKYDYVKHLSGEDSSYAGMW